MSLATPEELAERVLGGDLRALARASTLIEAQSEAGRKLLASLFSQTGGAMIVGITGPPGAGKSTLVSQIARVLRQAEQRVGIIAVDPSSPFSGGAILGDRIRMAEHHGDPGVFIRSMASRGRLGGLALATMETAMLIDASGFQAVLIETVGIGQAEIDVTRVADVTVLVLAPGFGDDIQTMKAGIMEAADLFAINKADQPGADRLEGEIRAMQSVASDIGGLPAAEILKVIATEGLGVPELVQKLTAVYHQRGSQSARLAIWKARLTEMLRDSLIASLPPSDVEWHANRVASKQEDPYSALAALRRSLP